MRHDEPLKKVTIRIFDSDARDLKRYYPDMGYNLILRMLVRRHLQELAEKGTAHTLSQQEIAEVNDV